MERPLRLNSSLTLIAPKALNLIRFLLAALKGLKGFYRRLLISTWMGS
ncbi:MAG: hypothetical protein QXH61_04750 [Candidatus Nezhaarchaeales archaeon]